MNALYQKSSHICIDKLISRIIYTIFKNNILHILYICNKLFFNLFFLKRVVEVKSLRTTAIGYMGT